MAQDQSGASATVLVVDDSDLARSEMMRLLVEDGLVVVGLASPIGATRAILANAVSVVVIDVLMPGMRGDRLAALFRGNPRLRELGLNWVGALLVSSAFFASYHLYQGALSTAYIFLYGLVLGDVFLLSPRIWPITAAHAFQNVFLYATA